MRRQHYELPALRNLAHIRRARGLTQAELAKRAGCCVRVIRYLEAGTRRPHSRELVSAIAAALGGVGLEVLSNDRVVISVRAGSAVIAVPSEGVTP